MQHRPLDDQPHGVAHAALDAFVRSAGAPGRLAFGVPEDDLPGERGGRMGLAVRRRVVERHGGRVWAEGRPGEGATVAFTLR